MNHEILIYNKTRHKAPKKFIKDLILKVLDFLELKQPVALAVLIVDKKEIKRLNKVWRKKNETPDELSFGLNSRQTPAFANNSRGVLNLGEIVVNVEKISEKKYLSEILIHSLLHLAGYGHEKSLKEAKQMERLEAKLLKHLNI
ncbi:rRNA maturation RNase YbeY [Candidatus Azambacteria bacterium]|nr:rRNA maturation RNase YbeY [Candidatus Azambacteria bacterium]